MDEARVQRIEIDFRLGLLLSDRSETAHVYFETPCYLNSQGEEILLAPDDTCTLAPILALFNAEVGDVAIHGSGRLVVTFKDGRSLEADPDERFEAWQIASPNGFLLVCSPGGSVSVFQANAVARDKERGKVT
jgi:hypothetical protein